MAETKKIRIQYYRSKNSTIWLSRVKPRPFTTALCFEGSSSWSGNTECESSWSQP